MPDLKDHLNIDTVYVKPFIYNGHKMYTIFDYEGHAFTSCESREIAFTNARLHGLIPMSMH